jgi:hypothetical protein
LLCTWDTGTPLIWIFFGRIDADGLQIADDLKFNRIEDVEIKKNGRAIKIFLSTK